MTVQYTDYRKPDSTAVDEIFYNDNAKELTLGLGGTFYRYSDVPRHDFNGLATADSVGKFYRTVIQKNYKPAEYLGRAVNFEQVGFGAGTEMPVSPDRAHGRSRPTTDYYVNVQSNRQGAGMPKALVENENTVITNMTTTGYSSGSTLNLNVKPSNVLLKHVVTFEANGRERQHTLRVASVDDAVRAVEEIADMLDLTFVIRKVEVFFE